MIKNLVSFGCSWPFGDELMASDLEVKHCSNPINDEYRNSHSFPGLIANHFNWDYNCLAYPGGSLQAMIWNLNWWLDTTPDDVIAESFILVGLTSETRNSWYNPYFQNRDSEWGIHRYMHSIWLQGGGNIKDEPFMEQWRELNKLYFMLSDCTQGREMRYAETVRFFDGISARYNIPMLQVKILSRSVNPKVPTLLDSITMQQLLTNEVENNDKKLFMPGLHPNEEGHQIISDYLIPHVKNAIIHE